MHTSSLRGQILDKISPRVSQNLIPFNVEYVTGVLP